MGYDLEHISTPGRYTVSCNVLADRYGTIPLIICYSTLQTLPVITLRVKVFYMIELPRKTVLVITRNYIVRCTFTICGMIILTQLTYLIKVLHKACTAYAYTMLVRNKSM